MENSVVICGATGYIGTHLVARLRSKGVSVKCLLRPNSNATTLEELGAEISYVELSGSKPLKTSLIESLAGSSAVVNLVGSISPRRGESLDSMDIRQVAKLVNLCNTCNIPKIVMVTALGTCENADSKYHASKWKAEQELKKSGLAYAILQPSLVYGRQVGVRDSKLVKRFMELINSRPIIPLIGGGHNRMQPIFIGDLIQCIEASLTDKKDGVWQLGGSEVVELKQFIEMLMKQLGQSKPFMDMPIAIARSIAAVCELTQDVPILNQDQVTLTLSDNICEHNALQDIFNITPTTIAVGLRSYSTQPTVPVSV
jgi:nucleoside-diphosphate-sugar epimerase